MTLMAETAMPRAGADPAIAIVGIGNPLIFHDRIGPRLLHMMHGRYGSQVTLFNAGTTPLALLDCIKGQDLMIVVDAVVGGERNIIVREMDFDAETPPVAAVHQIGPLETLRAARYLYPDQMPCRVVLILIESDAMNQRQEDRVCREVLAIVDGAVRGRRDAVWSNSDESTGRSG